MKHIKFKSTREGTFVIELPDNYEKIQLPYFDEWLSALESAKYRQCKGSLCKKLLNKKLGYCCLGVLSKIQGRLMKNEYHVYRDNTASALYLSSDNPQCSVFGHNGAFPSNVSVKKETKQTAAKTLATCNDDLNLSFKDIAKVIKTLYKA